jgi:hypothetical protein
MGQPIGRMLSGKEEVEVGNLCLDACRISGTKALEVRLRK